MEYPIESQLEVTIYDGAVTPLLPIHRTVWRTLPFYVLVNQENVNGRIQMNGLDYIADDLESFLVPRDVTHKLTWIEGKNPLSIWCHFNVTLFHSIDYFSFFEIPGKFSRPLSDDLREKCRELVTPSSCSPLASLAEKRKLAWEMVWLLLSGCRERKETKKRLSGLDKLHPALEYIKKHSGRDFQLSAAARSVNLSVSRFSAVFHSVMETSPGAYRNRLRLENAYQMLCTRSLPPKEVAFELDFYDVFHFSKAFKRQFGLTPTALLRRLETIGRF